MRPLIRCNLPQRNFEVKINLTDSLRLAGYYSGAVGVGAGGDRYSVKDSSIGIRPKEGNRLFCVMAFP